MELIHTKIKDYTLLREISAGQNSILFYAKNELGAEVAIKVLKDDADLDLAALRTHFFTQAKLLVALKHDHITQVIDFYQDENLVAIIMEYLDGQDLHTYMRKNPVTPVGTVLGWYEQILPAFEKAHQLSIVHRDVNPAALFLTSSGRLKILNFGVAKILQDALSQSLSGGRMKTVLRPDNPLYKSPQQLLRPGSVDQRTDIYALGLLFYILTTGTVPFDQDQLMDDILHKPLPMPPGYPQELFDVLAKATAKKADDGYRSCMEFLAALKTAVGSKDGFDLQKDITSSEKGKADAATDGANYDTGKTRIIVDEFTPGRDTRRPQSNGEQHTFDTGKTKIIIDETNDVKPGADRGKTANKTGPTEVKTDEDDVFIDYEDLEKPKKRAEPDKRPAGPPPPPPAGMNENVPSFEINTGNTIYSFNQIVAGAFFGGPVIAGYFLSENFKVFKDFNKSSRYMTNGVLLHVLNVAINFLAGDKATYFTGFIAMVVTFSITKNNQQALIESFARNNGKYKSTGNVILVCLIAFALQIFLFWRFGLLD